jgi:hypothetical protein
MSKQTARKMLYAWTALASILVVFAIVWAEKKKESPTIQILNPARPVMPTNTACGKPPATAKRLAG